MLWEADHKTRAGFDSGGCNRLGLQLHPMLCFERRVIRLEHNAKQEYHPQLTCSLFQQITYLYMEQLWFLTVKTEFIQFQKFAMCSICNRGCTLSTLMTFKALVTTSFT